MKKYLDNKFNQLSKKQEQHKFNIEVEQNHDPAVKANQNLIPRGHLNIAGDSQSFGTIKPKEIVLYSFSLSHLQNLPCGELLANKIAGFADR